MTKRSFGGHRMDRYLLDLEPDIDGTGDTPAGDPAAAVADPPDTSAADTPDTGDAAADTQPAGWSRDDPAFLDAVHEAAAGLLDQRLAALTQQQPQPVGPQPQGEQFDPNEFLNPLADDFGGNLVQFMQARDQWLLGQMQQMQQPIQQRLEQETIENGARRIDELIQADYQRHGDIKLAEGAKTDPADVIKQIAPVFLPETERVYGQNTPRAAEAALGKAAQLVRQLVRDAAAAGGQQNQAGLAALAAADREPGAASGAIRGHTAARNEAEVLRRFNVAV